MYDTTVTETLMRNVQMGVCIINNSCNIKGSTLAKLDCETLNMGGGTIENTEIKHSNFTGATFTGNMISNTTFLEMNMPEALIECEKFTDNTLTECNLTDITISSDMSNTNLIHCDMNNGEITGSVLQGTSFEQTDLSTVTGAPDKIIPTNEDITLWRISKKYEHPRVIKCKNKAEDTIVSPVNSRQLRVKKVTDIEVYSMTPDEDGNTTLVQLDKPIRERSIQNLDKTRKEKPDQCDGMRVFLTKEEAIAKAK
jgi:hypothetical protein